MRWRHERDAGRLPPWLPGIARVGNRFPAVHEDGMTSEAVSPICSGKGCRSVAAWVLAWNNPKLHTPDRRKTWAACDEHRESLATFLERRGFLRETLPLSQWDASAADR